MRGNRRDVHEFFCRLRRVKKPGCVPSVPTLLNVEIVVPLFPEMIRTADQTSRYSLLERFQCVGERVLLRFAEPVNIPTQAKTGLE